MLAKVTQHLHGRSTAALVSIENRFELILQGWLLVSGLACALRIAMSPLPAGDARLGTIAPYVLLILAPFVSALLALRWFEHGDRQPQPVTRLARVGRWRTLTAAEARRNPLYGTSGLMVSLMVGMLLNVPIRAAEYLSAMPPLPSTAPHWLSILGITMTFDVVVFSSLYTVAFVAALRKVPLFPRLLAAIWMADLVMQVSTATILGNTAGLPPLVGAALHGMIDGNVKKVLISIALWLPYLLLSARVNVTYRRRVPA